MQERKWSIPADLMVLPQWVCWGAPGKARKCPYNPRTGYPAKAGQPDTWADLATATAEVNAGHYEGVGFEFNSGGIVGVDFDHCIQGGKLDAWAAAWVERFNSYTEVSPSGTGLHILCRGKLPGEAVKKPRGEMYDRARYFTITGKPWDGPAKPLRDAQEAVTALYEELQAGTRKSAERPTEARTAPHGAVSIEDAPLIEKMKRGRNGAEFSRLWAGDISAYPLALRSGYSPVQCAGVVDELRRCQSGQAFPSIRADAGKMGQAAKRHHLRRNHSAERREYVPGRV